MMEGMIMQTLNPTKLAQELLLSKLACAACMIDGTAGNGKDTLFLAKNSPKDAIVYAFDIQESAIAASRELLVENHLDQKVELILDSHTHILDYIKIPIDVAMFNLGYLPGHCHETMTSPASTIQALSHVIEQLSVGGLLSVVAYPGHHQGQEEHHAVRNYVMELPAKQFTVVCLDMINHTKKPPVLYLIEKVRGSQVIT